MGCEAWTDGKGVLHVEISQRMPVLRFSYGEGQGYYIDAEGWIILPIAATLPTCG